MKKLVLTLCVLLIGCHNSLQSLRPADRMKPQSLAGVAPIQLSENQQAINTVVKSGSAFLIGPQPKDIDEHLGAPIPVIKLRLDKLAQGKIDESILQHLTSPKAFYIPYFKGKNVDQVNAVPPFSSVSWVFLVAYYDTQWQILEANNDTTVGEAVATKPSAIIEIPAWELYFELSYQNKEPMLELVKGNDFYNMSESEPVPFSLAMEWLKEAALKYYQEKGTSLPSLNLPK